MTVNNNICYIFNRIFLNFMKEIKGQNDEIKSILKQTYQIFDKKSDEYINYFTSNIDIKMTSGFFDEEQDILDNLEVLNVPIFVGITVHDILKKVVVDNVESRKSLKYYIYILLVIGYIYQIEMDGDKKSILLDRTLFLINGIDKKTIKEDELEKYLEDILDDDIQKMLMKMFNDRLNVTKPIMGGGLEMDDKLEFLNNTKIGELAKEISSCINFDGLNMDNPDNLSDMFSRGGSNMLGDIIQTVGTKITQKIQNGEINQEELMSEAMSMMGSLNTAGHGDMMSQMMSMMTGASDKNGGVGGMADMFKMMSGDSGGGKSNKTKERLQRKLDSKKK